MGKERKKTALWIVFLRGSIVALSIYLLGVLLLALLVVRGMLPESGTFPILAVLCVIAVLCGSLITVRKSPWGKLPTALLTSVIFGTTLTVVGVSFWREITGEGGILLLCALSGGVLAALLGSRKRKAGKRVRK